MAHSRARTQFLTLILVLMAAAAAEAGTIAAERPTGANTSVSVSIPPMALLELEAVQRTSARGRVAEVAVSVFQTAEELIVIRRVSPGANSVGRQPETTTILGGQSGPAGWTRVNNTINLAQGPGVHDESSPLEVSFDVWQF